MQVTGPEALDPRQPAEVERLRAGERGQLDGAGDQTGSEAAAMVAAPPLIECPTITAGPPRCRTRGEEVAGDVGAGVAVPPRLESPLPGSGSRRGRLHSRAVHRHHILEDLAADIRNATGRQVHVIAADLSIPGVTAGVVATLAERGLRVDTLINNAGLGKTAPFAASAIDDVHAQIGLNVAAVVDLTHALLPQLLASGRGAVLNIASLTAYAPTPNMAVYAASKAFVLRFTEALAYKLRDSSLSVLALSPGPTRTGFYATSGTTETGVRFQQPTQVVASAFGALDRPKSPVSVVSGWQNRVSSRVLGLLPAAPSFA